MTYAGTWTCFECGDTSDNEHDPCSCDDTCTEHIETIDSLRRRLKQAETERDAARTRIDELLVTVRNLSLQTPYPEESRNAATLIAEVGTLRSQLSELRRNTEQSK